MSEEEIKTIKNEEQVKRRSIIDLSLGLETISSSSSSISNSNSGNKIKRGSIDLSLGLEYEKKEQNKSNVPSIILKYGLERQTSEEENIKEENNNNNNNNINDNINISSDLLQLLQLENKSEEAWEVKVDIDHNNKRLNYYLNFYYSFFYFLLLLFSYSSSIFSYLIIDFIVNMSMILLIHLIS